MGSIRFWLQHVLFKRNLWIRKNSGISTVIRGCTARRLLCNFSAMPYGQSYRKRAQLLGVLLALADDNAHQRVVLIREIRETMVGLKRTNPIFRARLFARVVAQTAFPTNPERESELLAELLADSAPAVEQVA